MSLTLMYITNNPIVALIAEKNGVDRIWVDLETHGKEERQKNMNTVKSHHTIADIITISNVLTRSELLVRINPWCENSFAEIEKVISAGADRIMLPMWKSVCEVDGFLRTINGRVHTTLLLETKEAVECLDKVLENPLVEEIHIGLNDLHLSYGMEFMFQPLANGIVEKIIKKLLPLKLPYGFGGIAKLGFGDLPAEKIIKEHYRLGSTRTILSRSFCSYNDILDFNKFEKEFSENIRNLRAYEKYVANLTETELIENMWHVIAEVDKIVMLKKGK